APDAQKMIARLGLGVPKDVLVNPQLFAVRTIDLTNRLERLYQRFYFNMDRDRFDRWLVSIVPPVVEKKFSACFKGFDEVPGGYEIRYVHHGETASVKTKVLVGADGAFSKVRRCLGADANPPERYVSIQEWFECPHAIPYFTAIFDEEISDFYSWIIPKEDSILLGAALRPGAQAWDAFERLKAKLAPLGFHLDRKIKTEGAYLYRPKKGSQLNPGRGGVALIGEAAGAISPSSAEGISYAFKSSLYLAQSLEEGIDGFMNRYRKSVREIRRNLLLKNLKSPGMYSPPLRRLVMQSGLQSIR
ncbi:MAG TPA: FAD-binding protein, partial [Clostridia bacterium]|nr:FAD-binding protein [Clostridia bacterium]